MSGLVWLGIFLLVVWAILWLGFHIVASVIHLLVILAAVCIVWGLVKRRVRSVDRHT